MYILNIGVSTNDILKPEYSLLNFSYVFLPISILIKRPELISKVPAFLQKNKFTQSESDAQTGYQVSFIRRRGSNGLHKQRQ